MSLAALSCGSVGGSGVNADNMVVGTATSGPIKVGGAGEGMELDISAPATATLTLFLRDFTGMDHVAVGQRTKEEAENAMRAETGSKGDFYLVHGERRSVLYHGFYKTIDPEVDRSEASRAARDRKTLEAMGVTAPDGQQIKAFPRAVFAPLEHGDPTAPPQWDLRNATDTNQHWTICIAVYTDDALRKQAAVQSVADARKRGVEAYYLHDSGASYVTVGSWPEAAVDTGPSVKEVNERRADPGNPPKLIVSSYPLSQQEKDRIAERSGGRTIVVDKQTKIVDDNMKRRMDELEYYVNGEPTGQRPLMFIIPVITGRADSLEAETLERAPDSQEMNELLRRPF